LFRSREKTGFILGGGWGWGKGGNLGLRKVGNLGLERKGVIWGWGERG